MFLVDKAFLGHLKQPLRSRGYFRDHPCHLLETKLKCVNCALWVTSEASLGMGLHSAACAAGVECWSTTVAVGSVGEASQIGWTVWSFHCNKLFLMLEYHKATKHVLAW